MFSRIFRWVPPLIRNRCKLFLLLHLISMLPGHQIQVRAHYCYVGQERDGNNNWRWVLPYEDPCECTGIRFGGLNTDTPVRPFHPVYVDEPLVSDDIEEIRDHYGLTCKESESPEVICPANQTEETKPSKPTAAVVWKSPILVKSDSSEVSIDTCVPVSGSNFTIGQHKVLCTAIGHGHGDQQVTCHFYVNVIDKEQPKIKSCSTNQTKETDRGQPTATVVWDKPTATDNSEVMVNVVCVPTPGSNFTIGPTEVVCEAADSSDNKAICSFYVNITDKEPPKINSCPTNITKETDIGQPTATLEWEGPTATDNSEEPVNVVCVPKSGYNFTIGQTEVVCEAADSSDNKATCSFLVNITDKEPPKINFCPTNLTKGTDNGQPTAKVVWDVPTATDNSGEAVSVTCGPSPGSNFMMIQSEVVCEAIDGSGNKAICRFHVNIIDQEPPTIDFCQTNLTKGTDLGQPTAKVVWDVPTATDNSGEVVNVTCEPSSGSNFIMNQTDVVCKAADNSGNKAMCRFHVNIIDMEAPELTCPDNIDLVANHGTRTTIVTWSAPQVKDNSGLPPISVWCSRNNGTKVQIGGRSFYYNANDTSGNIDTCSFRVTLTDKEPPVVGCPSTMLEVSLPGRNSNFVYWKINNMASDNDMKPPARTVTAQCTPSPGSLFHIGRTVVTCTAYDYSKNSVKCSFVVEMKDSACYVMPAGEDYRGYKSITENGLTCQNWMSHSPHDHTHITPDSYPYAGLGDHNYCRNPDYDGSKPWCYTTDPSVHWEYCDVGQPQTFCLVCVNPLGMEDGRIKDRQITASSYPGGHTKYHGEKNSRLNYPGNNTRAGAWCADDLSPWIRVDLGVSKLVSGIVLQGRADLYIHWVTKYTVDYGNDGISWLNAESVNPGGRKFTGNSDKTTPVTGWFASTVRASIIRIHPIKKEKYLCLRFELLGCEDVKWQMVYKAVAGVSTPDPYELWISNETSQFRPYYSPTCHHPPPNNTVATHCKTYNILDWDNLDIEEVKINLFDNTGVELLNIRFIATGSTSNNWMTKDRVIRSPFTDIASLTYFSIEGDNTDNRGRRFYMASHDECEGDAGLLVMKTGNHGCEWETMHNQVPVFLYSKLSTRVIWNDGFDAGLGKADVFAIFIKTKITDKDFK